MLRPVKAWLFDSKLGAARVLGVASAAALFVFAAHLGQLRMTSGFRHTGLIFAAYSLLLIVAGGVAALLAPSLVRAWAVVSAMLGEPSPAAAIVLVSVVGGGVMAWSLLGAGPPVAATMGGALLLLTAGGAVAGTVSRRRR